MSSAVAAQTVEQGHVQAHIALAMAGQLRSPSFRGRRDLSVLESRTALAADLPLVAFTEGVLSVVRLRPEKGEHLRPGERFVRILRPARFPEKATVTRISRTRSLNSGTIARGLPTWSYGIPCSWRGRASLSVISAAETLRSFAICVALAHADSAGSPSGVTAVSGGSAWVRH